MKASSIFIGLRLIKKNRNKKNQQVLQTTQAEISKGMSST